MGFMTEQIVRNSKAPGTTCVQAMSMLYIPNTAISIFVIDRMELSMFNYTKWTDMLVSEASHVRPACFRESLILSQIFMVTIQIASSNTISNIGTICTIIRDDRLS